MQAVLNLRLAEADVVIVGTFTHEDGRTFEITAERDSSLPANQSTRYTALLSAETPSAVRGFLLAACAQNGSVKLTGSLPDGTALTLGTRVSERRGLSVFIPCYAKGAGYLAGTAHFEMDLPMRLVGDLSWEKPAAAKGAYAQGLDDVMVALDGAPYTRPVLTRMLDDFNISAGAGVMRLSGGGLGSELSNMMTLTGENRVLIAPGHAHRPKLVMQPATGLFSGSFLHTDGAMRRFKGVCIQNPGVQEDTAQGFFVATPEPGMVELAASP